MRNVSCQDGYLDMIYQEIAVIFEAHTNQI